MFMIKINLGADISKETIDFFCDANSELFQLKNNAKGLDKLLMWADQHQYPLNQIAIAFEHTTRDYFLSCTCLRN